ncbi:spartin-like [Limulus polyphemus]|uniref:Spartin-like n=1 Tax=Limulus polyphemus TaxID=6850 RepID=A0ABM1BHM7_LIMPO|nr:spartin-like [Limulus polyphemus]
MSLTSEVPSGMAAAKSNHPEKTCGGEKPFSEEETNIEENLQTIKTNHDEAYIYVSQGITYEEEGHPYMAKEMYIKGLKKLEKAINVRCDRPYCAGRQWNDARKMQQKMRQTISEVESRIRVLTKLPQPSSLSLVSEDNLPSYEEACPLVPVSSPSTNISKNHDISDVSISLSESMLDGELGEVADDIQVEAERAEELFSIPGGVQLFCVSPEGYVSVPSSPTCLYIYKFTASASGQASTRPPAWLQIGNWSYPLLPGKSPVLHSGFGAFMFPDVTSREQKAAVGVILPGELDPKERIRFEQILSELTVFEEEPKSKLFKTVSEEERLSHKISRGIVAGAEMVSLGLAKGMEYTGEWVRKGAAMLREKVPQSHQPSTVDPRVQRGLKVAVKASGTAVRVSGYLVSKLGKLTMALGEWAVPHIKNQGSKVLSKTLQVDVLDSKNSMDDVLIVAAGSVAGFSTVYMGLEKAAKALASCLADETVQVVQHRYGKEASEVASDAVQSIGNLAYATYNFNSLGVKAIAKRTAKDTGKAVLKDYIEQVDKGKDRKVQQQGTSGYLENKPDSYHTSNSLISNHPSNPACSHNSLSTVNPAASGSTYNSATVDNPSYSASPLANDNTKTNYPLVNN